MLLMILFSGMSILLKSLRPVQGGTPPVLMKDGSEDSFRRLRILFLRFAKNVNLSQELIWRRIVLKLYMRRIFRRLRGEESICRLPLCGFRGINIQAYDVLEQGNRTFLYQQ